MARGTCIFVFSIALLAAAALAVMLLADRWIENSFFSAHVLNFLLQTHLLHTLFVPAGPMESLHITGFFGLAVLCAIPLGLKALFNKWRCKPRPPLQAALVGIANLAANLAVLALVMVLFLNMLMAGYVNRVFEDIEPSGAKGAGYAEKVKLIEAHMQSSEQAVRLTLQKLMADVERGTVKLDTLSDEAYIDLAEVMCYLVDLNGGVDSEALHYFRNYFSRAPATLREMTDTILHHPGNRFGWKLLPPASTFFHMAGPNGEFNLKFVSADGHFEAVYNRDGALLTQENGPENMGTLNYADPVSNPEKHALYDVMPYLAWGNVPGVPAISRSLDEDLKAKFEENADAKQYHKHYQQLLGG